MIGAFAGDGNYHFSDYGRGYSYRIRYYFSYQNELVYAKYLFDLLKKANLNPHLFYQKSRKLNYINLVTVSMRSKVFIEFIKSYLFWEGKKTYSVCLKESLNEYDSAFLIGFVRGLMNTDGFVSGPAVFFKLLLKI